MKQNNLILVLALTLLVVVGCIPKVGLSDVYHYVADCPAKGAVRDIQVSTATDGNTNLRPLDESVTQTLIIDVTGGRAKIRFGDIEIPGVFTTSSSGQRELIFCHENPGSRNIHIAIKDAGYTKYAGLRFTQEVVINIWENGVIEADRPGIEATDRSGVVWISRKARVNGTQAIVFLRKTK